MPISYQVHVHMDVYTQDFSDAADVKSATRYVPRVLLYAYCCFACLSYFYSRVVCMCAVVVTSDASRWVLSTSFQTTPKPPAVPNEHENVINRGKKNVTYI